jgi:predicted transcriptional regulator
MTTKTILNMDSQLKKAAMTKARKEGTTLSAVLNAATRRYVQGEMKIQAVDPDWEEAMAEIRAGKSRPMEEVFKDLGL